MSNWALVFLLLAVVGIIFEVVTDKYCDWIWFALVINTILNVSSAIKEDLERVKEKLNHQNNRG